MPPKRAIKSGQDALILPLTSNPGTAVTVTVDRLRTTPIDKMLALLQSEVVPLKYWRRLALEYYKLGMKDNFLAILGEGTSDEDDFKEAYQTDMGEVNIYLFFSFFLIIMY